MLEQINDLYKIADYMDDDELTRALEFVAQVILSKDIPVQNLSVHLVKLQAIGFKMAMQATWLANVDKGDRARKNLYYTASEQINNLCQAIKYSLK